MNRKKPAALLLVAAMAWLHAMIHSSGADNHTFASEPTVTNAGLVPLVHQRIREWQPTRDERMIDAIGWARTILDGERLARQHGRPLFLFTLDGRMDLGRC
jgi:hypothetical protein